VLYQLSYFRSFGRYSIFKLILAKVAPFSISWGKVVLYQLSYFRSLL